MIAALYAIASEEVVNEVRWQSGGRSKVWWVEAERGVAEQNYRPVATWTLHASLD